MKIILIIENNKRIYLDCEKTTIERVKYLTSQHTIKDVIYIR